MSKKIVYLLLAVSLGLNAGVIAMTLIHRTPPPMQGPPRGPGGPQGAEVGQRPEPGHLVDTHMRGMTRHLELDSEQQESIRLIMESHAPELAALQIEAAEAGRRLSEAYGAPAFDPDQFRQLAAETAATRSRVDSLSAVLLVAEAAVLTPEQRRKFAEVAPSMNKARQGPRAGGPPPRKGS